jgi:hypothetical protein
MRCIFNFSILNIIVLITVMLFSLPMVSESITIKENPKIVFDEREHDFGKVSQGTILEFNYKFTNEGNGKLVITNVQTSCGCTGAVIDGKKEFEENETGEIKVTFNTQGREGIQSKTIVISSNDPIQPQIVLSFKCEIFKNQ